MQVIIKNKIRIIQELYEWAETFNWELDEEGERSLKNYDTVFNLVQKLENNLCSESDYIDILFHIKQINYNETRIKLI